MLISSGCIPCILKQSQALCNLLGVKDTNVQTQIMYDTMNALLENKEIPTAPHFSAYLQSIMNKHLNGAGSLKKIKEENRTKAEKYLKYLETMMDAADDRLEMAVRIAITGNTIDLGANPNFDLEKEINIISSSAIHLEAFRTLKEDVRNARRILYIADNYEEALFDKFLIRQLLPKEIIYAVRSNEILNDITLEDAKNLKMDTLCPVIESGSRITGTALEQASNEFIEVYHSSDLVIAKGQGNFETLLHADRPIYFMFKVKCEAISEMSGFPIGTGILFLNKKQTKELL
jgi:damage-control phosphatase, subfamily I